MKNTITLNQITVQEKQQVIYQYSVEGEWEKYFSSQRTSYIEYDVDITCVPPSVLWISFICNVLPVAWVCDATIEADALDDDFMAHVEEIKQGYINMYPMLSFRGNIHAKREKNEQIKAAEASGCFFSGGVDAHATFFRHLEEKPELISIWGSDIELNDNQGWSNVLGHIEETAKNYGVVYHIIKSDFRSVLREDRLSKLVQVSGDGWWHGFQHGIALISHAAPLAYVKGWNRVYIASSFSDEMKGLFTCASDPSIDNHLWVCGCRTIHDAYEWNRQQKVEYIVKRRLESKQPVFLRVCWESRGGRNCCHCEKCYRTILELVAEGADPNDYGFSWDRESIKRCKGDIKNRITLLDFIVKQFYYPIQARLNENRNIIHNYDDYKWFISWDLATFNTTFPKRIRGTMLYKLLRKINAVFRG